MKNLLFIFTIISMNMACDNSENESTNQSEDQTMPAPTVVKSSFGSLDDGTGIDLYTLENSAGMKVGIITYGGIVQSIEVPDKDGNWGDVVLGHDNIAGYLAEGQNPYFGGIIGRYGNRIAGGQFEIDESIYTLATNDGPNHLHGGPQGFDKVVWSAKEITGEDHAGVMLTYRSADGEEGYPGNLDIEVTYLLDNNNGLEILYEATTDQSTVVNLTNHSYFNLGADKTSILEHQLMMNADRYLPVDNTLIPTGVLAEVSGTPFDFTEMKEIGAEINVENEQLARGGGYDHCWVFKDGLDYNTVAAELYEANSGRVMKIYTTEPAVQFYSGNFLDGTINGKGSTSYPHRSGLCLETQHYPDSPNQADFPSTRLDPGTTYSTKTKMVFGVR